MVSFAVPLILLASSIGLIRGDPNDWVSVDYIVAKSQAASRGAKSPTADSEAAIVRNADSLAGQGPWSIVNSKQILPPSGDSHDYLSWAPYHWPDCDWCPNSKNHLAQTGGSLRNDTSATPSTSVSTMTPGYQDEYLEAVVVQQTMRFRRQKVTDQPISLPTSIASITSRLSATSVLPKAPTSPTDAFTTPTPDKHTGGPAQAAAKTTKSSCTPSPTKSLAPSATWTTCPYVPRDGQVNPDVRTLKGPEAINLASQAIISSAEAWILKKSRTYSSNIAKFIDTFFLNDDSRMNPNLNFGQIVRGRGEEGREGTFTGILDLRGMVKIVNGISICRATKCPDWTTSRDNAMKAWVSEYSKWLANSNIGHIAASRPNNHVTFYVSQDAALKVLANDKQGAITTLQRFFKTQFLDQIAASGEQPFEAIRTRPFHYRCFNLEGLITNAKIGDQLGVDFWTAKSKYGATIQTALDFTMASDPNDEDVAQLLPHVAAVAAAYGDPKGKYASFLKKHEPKYESKAYWFYDQAAALAHSPSGSSMKKRGRMWRRDGPMSVIPFTCPTVFEGVVEVEIDDGIYVRCDELRPLYETAAGGPTLKG